MAKKIFTGFLGVFLVIFGAVCVFANDLPEVTEETKVYVKYGGNDKADGLTPDTAKATLGQLDGSGAVSLLEDGGTLVTSGKIVVGGSYVLPKLGSALLITADDGTVNYMGTGNNPVGALKMADGASLTLQSDVIFDKIHLFQEYSTSNVIKVTNNSTLVVGSEVVCSSNTNLSKPVYMTIEVEAGSTVILNGGIFQKVTGSGTVINNSATIIESGTASAFSASRTYENQFTDLEENAWYRPYIQTAYEYALANGTSDTKFSPDGKFTVAQALTAAANIHTAYTGNAVSAAAAGEAWYAPYAAYCVQHGIITETQFADYNRNITRGEMAIVFANILPDDAYTAVRSGTNPDVTAGMDCYDAVQKLYNAGIVGGDSGTGNYRPNDEIVRSEACVIFTRIAVAEYRAK